MRIEIREEHAPVVATAVVAGEQTETLVMAKDPTTTLEATTIAACLLRVNFPLRRQNDSAGS